MDYLDQNIFLGKLSTCKKVTEKSSFTDQMVTVGVLALQGAFHEHIHVLKNLKINAIEIRTEKELMGCDGLILPGMILFNG